MEEACRAFGVTDREETHQEKHDAEQQLEGKEHDGFSDCVHFAIMAYDRILDRTAKQPSKTISKTTEQVAVCHPT